ncbi:unnamed protein product [Rhizophagus irregularis]|uniref:Uncharacterized protein n=1 Tax=Rhizophagus irregularis TaxID=588596 RepID=A0A916E2I9_9GLOM|nr:unnamed protein product [Rhizophagus irregularis]
MCDHSTINDNYKSHKIAEEIKCKDDSRKLKDNFIFSAKLKRIKSEEEGNIIYNKNQVIHTWDEKYKREIQNVYENKGNTIVDDMVVDQSSEIVVWVELLCSNSNSSSISWENLINFRENFNVQILELHFFELIKEKKSATTFLTDEGEDFGVKMEAMRKELFDDKLCLNGIDGYYRNWAKNLYNEQCGVDLFVTSMFYSINWKISFKLIINEIVMDKFMTSGEDTGIREFKLTNFMQTLHFVQKKGIWY